ncbi:DUF3157 family protein [Gallaecimonas xiamenensis]|uniref:DUF3157 domain-containing protein n=1 Tax=Gallaecimonas xiamenensis 3-C-1 TaxID=745411 RepID=K2JPJ3_9GAMM|nr:DUF3157 family protein [Gallaecimonas xiamenensis]EKE72409.1 hypothetical protein B3C1_11272 [Gallaecimonas xiamenensis 3-C-1]
MYKKFALPALLLGLSLPALAAEVAQVTLPNGMVVRLKDDFTWEYVIAKTPDQHLAPQALAQAELLASTAKDRVKLKLARHQWQDGRLGLVFNLENDNSENVVKVVADAQFFDDQGKPIKRQSLVVWQAEYRMPESYLRKGQSRDSRELWVEGIDPAQWQKGLVSLSISKLQFR